MSSFVIQVNDVTHRYGNTVALDKVNIQFEKSKLHAIVGENGAGKSTLLGLIAGLNVPTKGNIQIFERKLNRRNPALVAHSLGVSLLLQHGSLMPNLSIFENFLLVCKQQKVSLVNKAKLRQQVINTLTEFELNINLDQLVATLTPAICQQVELARILWINSDLIIFDEPSANLSEEKTKDLFNLCRKLVAQGKTIIFTTHRINEAIQYADTLTVFRGGKAVSQDTTHKLTDKQVFELMFGSSIPSHNSSNDNISKQVVFELRDLVCHNSNKTINLKLTQGQIVGVVGEPNQGQDELIATISGLIPPVSGDILLNGNVVIDNPNQQTKIGCFLGSPIKHAAVRNMTIAENLVLHNHYQKPYALSKLLNWVAINKNGTTTLASIDLNVKTATSPLSILSGGNQRKIVLARELNKAKSFFLAHNLEAGLDAQYIAKLVFQLQDLCNNGLTALIFAEEYKFLDDVANQVYVINQNELFQLPTLNWQQAAREQSSGITI